MGFYIAAYGGVCGNRPAAEVIPERKPARDANDIHIARQGRIFVPNHLDLASGLAKRHGQITITVGTGEDDNRSAHQGISIW